MIKLQLPIITRITSILAVISAVSAAHTSAEDVKQGMTALLTPFKAIQPYIASEERFIDSGDNEKLLQIIRDLRTNFHRLERVPAKYRELPGFMDNIRKVNDLLDDADRRFHEGKRSYAWWRLRKLPSDCFSCHATYKVESRYSNLDVVDSNLDPLNRARFLLATRQFLAAQEAFKTVLKDSQYRSYFNEALRSLVLITTRITKDPADGSRLLRAIASSSDLPKEDAREALEWATELDEWSTELKERADASGLNLAEKLIIRGASATPERPRNDVALLRGTALLHQQLESGSLSHEFRPHALYLLGFAYSKLGLFFSEDWAAYYLEQCIIEFPGTALAQKAFKVYRQQTIENYTGSGGTSIPAEVQLHLDQLRGHAYNTPAFTPRVSLKK
jgi:hypothetical protein